MNFIKFKRGCVTPHGDQLAGAIRSVANEDEMTDGTFTRTEATYLVTIGAAAWAKDATAEVDGVEAYAAPASKKSAAVAS